MQAPYHNIYILGGHKLATQYFEKLTRAKLKAQQIFAVTDDPKAHIYSQAHSDHVIALSNAEFMLKYTFENRPHANDILVPDHTAKHVMLQTQLAIAKKLLPQALVQLTPLNWPLQTPFLHKFENEALVAMSYATWTCAADCNEPSICPHTKKKRDWDFNTSLKPVYESLSSKNVICFDYACEPLFEEISQIPMSFIHEQLNRFKSTLQDAFVSQKYAVATHSHCHGIVGGFEVVQTQ